MDLSAAKKAMTSKEEDIPMPSSDEACQLSIGVTRSLILQMPVFHSD